jgi:hypothetical protein
VVAKRAVALAALFALTGMVKAVLQFVIFPVIICKHAQDAELP